MGAANDQLSLVKKQISKTLNELENSNHFKLPRSLSTDRLAVDKFQISSESVAAVMNNSKSLNELSQYTKHVSNPMSIFTSDPFSKVSTPSQTVIDQKGKDSSTQTQGKDNTQVEDKCVKVSQQNACIQVDIKVEKSLAVMAEKDIPKQMQKEPLVFSKDCLTHELELLRSKLQNAQAEIKSLHDQNRIISVENQKLIVQNTTKKEDVTTEREILYGFIHDFVINNTINDHSVAKSLVDQMSKNLYSLIEHCNDVTQLNRIKDMFLSYRESVVKIINESILLDNRISNLATSSNTIRMESEAIISQLEAKSTALIKENEELKLLIHDMKSLKISSEDKNTSTKESTNTKSSCLKESSTQEDSILVLKSENEKLKMQLAELKLETPVHPLSDLYNKILSLVNRDASSGINIKEILEWVQEKNTVVQELQNLQTSHSSNFILFNTRSFIQV